MLTIYTIPMKYSPSILEIVPLVTPVEIPCFSTINVIGKPNFRNNPGAVMFLLSRNRVGFHYPTHFRPHGCFGRGV